MTKSYRLLLTVAVLGTPLCAQTEASYLRPILEDEILAPQIAALQLRQYVLHRVAKPPTPTTAEQWTAESATLRKRLLNEVMFHGWPREWVDAPPKFEEVGVIAGNGYRIRKLRYEIVPGFQSVALLYEPENLHGKVPTVLNVNGPVGPPGKSVGQSHAGIPLFQPPISLAAVGRNSRCHGMQRLDYVLQKPVQYEAAPDLFCLDLLLETNLDPLTALSAPARVLNEQTAGAEGRIIAI